MISFISDNDMDIMTQFYILGALLVIAMAAVLIAVKKHS